MVSGSETRTGIASFVDTTSAQMCILPCLPILCLILLITSGLCGCLIQLLWVLLKGPSVMNDSLKQFANSLCPLERVAFSLYLAPTEGEVLSHRSCWGFGL